ncbi:MAG TPA: LysM peptidoglycan-binding domain-containing protein [Aggregatilineales bacterium]|nr:LysM peptidoglycan-binding domain-containing protein [Aggregatilineales bacterium]
MGQSITRSLGLTVFLAAFTVMASGCFQTVGASGDTTVAEPPTATLTPPPAPTLAPLPTIPQATATLSLAQPAAVAQEATSNPQNSDQATATALIAGITQTFDANNTLAATLAGTPVPSGNTQPEQSQPGNPTLTPTAANGTPQGTVGQPGSGAAGLITADCVYTVVEGDRLFRIALRFNLTTETVARANGVVNPDLILPDQKFRIPYCNATPVPAGAIRPNVASLADKSPTDSGKTYVVQEGDTLYAISTRFGVKIQAVAQTNNIANINLIYIGQSIVIP